jgi:hypothetical protein
MRDEQKNLPAKRFAPPSPRKAGLRAGRSKASSPVHPLLIVIVAQEKRELVLTRIITTQSLMNGGHVPHEEIL